jgi:hypothetical protein
MKLCQLYSCHFLSQLQNVWCEIDVPLRRTQAHKFLISESLFWSSIPYLRFVHVISLPYVRVKTEVRKIFAIVIPPYGGRLNT